MMRNLPAVIDSTPELICGDGASLLYRPKLFSIDAEKLVLPTGISVLAGIRMCFRQRGYEHISLRGCVIMMDGVPIARDKWHTTIITKDSLISIHKPVRNGGDGKNPLNTILSVVVAVIAIVVMIFAPYTAPAWLGGFAGFNSALATAVMVGGMLLVNAIAPLSQPKLKAGADAQTAERNWATEGVQNKFDPYGVIPIIVGKVRFAPNIIALPYSYLEGNNVNVRYLFGVLGHNKVSGLRIGATNAADYRGFRCNIYENWKGEQFEFFSNRRYEEALSIQLRYNVPHIRTTSANARKAYLVDSFQNGIGYIDKNGKLLPTTIRIRTEYSVSGMNQWSPAIKDSINVNSGIFSILVKHADLMGGARSRPIYVDANGNPNPTSGKVFVYINWEYGGSSVYFSHTENFDQLNLPLSATFTEDAHTSGIYIHISVGAGSIYSTLDVFNGETVSPQMRGTIINFPQPGRYDVRRTRITSDADPNNTQERFFNDSSWSAITSVEDGQPVIYSGRPMTIFEVDIRSSEQLSGRLSEFNAFFESYCPVYDQDTDTWSEQPSNNPADLTMMLLTTNVNGKPDGMDKIHAPGVLKFRDWCQKMGWKYNSVFLGQKEAREDVHDVLASARGSIDFKYGKFSPAYDDPESKISFTFGPRNSWDFSYTQDYIDKQPHALKYRFTNERADFQDDEYIVYADGYNASNALEILEAEQDGVTDPDLIYKTGRLRLADSRLRPRYYTLTTDFSFIVVSRLSWVTVTSYVAMWGYEQGRIIGYVYGSGVDPETGEGAPEDRITHVKLDIEVNMVADKNYGLAWFSPQRGKEITIAVVSQDTTTNTLELPFPLPESDLPPDGSLVSFGIAGSITRTCVVVAILPQDNGTAKIILQDASPEVYQAISGPIPEFNSGVTIPDRWNKNRPATPLVTGLRSDELVLLPLGGTSFLPRIQIAFSQPERDGVIVERVFAQIREFDVQESSWREAGSVLSIDGVIYIRDVEELREYEIRLYSVSDVGTASNFSAAHRIVVIGRTTPPPPPIRVHLDGSLVWWEMSQDAPMDIVGYQVLMGFDEHHPFSYAKPISDPITPFQNFDVSEWSGWARRIWIRTVDALGLMSDPVSVVINLGDVPVDNVVHAASERSSGWNGVIQGGTIYDDMLLSKGTSQFFGPDLFFGPQPFFGRDYQQLVYTTHIYVPWQADQANLKIELDKQSGIIDNIEHAYAQESLFFGPDLFFGPQPFFGTRDIGTYFPLTNEISVLSRQLIFVRITMSTLDQAQIRDMLWIFDVEDAEPLRFSEFSIQPQGTLLPVPEKYFRWISHVTIDGLEYIDGSTAISSFFEGRGKIENGFVVEGPKIICVDNQGSSVNGIVDVTLHGARGIP